MPPLSRAQRRRQAARQQNRSASAGSRAPRTPPAEPAEPAAEAPALAAEAGRAPSTGATVPLSQPGAGAARPARQTRRPVARPAPEPVNTDQDYASARRDLIRILIWSVLLFGGMIALKISGVI